MATLSNALNTGVFPLPPSQGGTGVNNTNNQLVVSSNSFINQDLRTTASPSFAGIVTGNNFNTGYTTTPNTGGTTVLTANSSYQQFFTGTLTQTVRMPVVSVLPMALGQQFLIANISTQNVTVQSSGANTILIVEPGFHVVFTCILLNGTTEASWTTDTVAPGSTVNSLQGTVNQVLVNGGLGPAVGNVTLTLPQSIGTSNNVSFGSLTLNPGFVSMFTPSGPLKFWTGIDNNATNLVAGVDALILNAGGINIAGFGFDVLSANTTGSDLTAFGYQALDSNTTGNRNSAFGMRSGVSLDTGSGNTLLGESTDVDDSSASNTIALGSGAIGRIATGVTDADFSPGISIGSDAHPVGVRGDGLLFGGESIQGFWRPIINNIAYYSPLFLPNVSLIESGVMLTNSSGSPIISENLPVENLDGGIEASSTTFWRGDGSWGIPSGGGIPFHIISVDFQLADLNAGYVNQFGPGACTIQLPNVVPVGSVVSVRGYGTGGWSLVCGNTQVIHYGTISTSPDGAINSTGRYDTIDVICVRVDSEWVVTGSVSDTLILS